MTLEEKLLQLRSAAELKLGEAQKSMEAEDFETAATLQKEADKLLKNAKIVQAQIEKVNVAKDLKKEEKPEVKNVSSDPVRLPFEDIDDGVDSNNDAEKTMDVTSAIHVLKYGTTEKAVKAIINDVYGPDYNQKRSDQMDAFTKFVRRGENYLSPSERALLETCILRPENIKEDVLTGTSVKTIKATLQEMLNDLGGFLVPEDYRMDIIQRMTGLTQIRNRARVVTTNRDAAEWPRLEGGNSQYTSAVRVTWVDELPSSATVADTNPTWGMLRVPVHTVMARTDVSRNQLEDSAFNLMDILAEMFAEAMAIDEDTQFLTGRGGGTPLGILGGGTALEPAPDTGIETVNSGDASALTSDGLYNLVYGLHSQYRRNAVLLGERLSHRDLRKLKDGNSRYLWEDSLKVGEPPTLLGYPFLEDEGLPTVAANAYPLIFGDLLGYLIVDRIGMSVERVTDVTTTGQNKVALFARRRLGGQVIEPWRFQVQKVAE